MEKYTINKENTTDSDDNIFRLLKDRTDNLNYYKLNGKIKKSLDKIWWENWDEIIISNNCLYHNWKDKDSKINLLWGWEIIKITQNEINNLKNNIKQPVLPESISRQSKSIEVKEKPKLNWVVTINNVSTWFVWNDWYLYFSAHSDTGNGTVKVGDLTLSWVKVGNGRDIARVKIPKSNIWNISLKIGKLDYTGRTLYSTTWKDDRTWELWDFVKYNKSVVLSNGQIVNNVWEYKKTNIWSVWDSWSPVYDENWNTIWLISWESATGKNVYVSFF